MPSHDVETKSRLLATIVRELLASSRFDTLADLTGALKDRCARLRIRIVGDDIDGAYRLIASNRSLVADPYAGLERRVERRALTVDSAAVPAADAARLYREIMRRYRHENPAPSEAGRPTHFPNLMPVPGWE